MSNAALNLLGIALRGGNLTVGEEPVEAVARARDARLLILAADAADIKKEYQLLLNELEQFNPEMLQKHQQRQH